jgi:DNA-binding transcriptional LysR family regulator
MVRKLDLDSLEIFRAVAHEGSVTRAAHRLNRVQSNISTRIRQLEERLGVSLFERRNRSLILSAHGHTLMHYAQQLLDLSAQAEQALTDGVPRGHFKIGTMESTAAARLPPLLVQFHQRYPDVQIQLLPDMTASLLERLHRCELDAVFVAQSGELRNVSSRTAFTERLVVITPAAERAVTSIEELNQTSIVAFRQGCAYRGYLEGWLRQFEIVPCAIIEVGSYHAIVACVAAGMGVAVIPESVLAVMPPQIGVQRVPIPQLDTEVDTLLVWREGFYSPALSALQDMLSHQ